MWRTVILMIKKVILLHLNLMVNAAGTVITTGYSYNANGQPLRLSLPGGESILYEYDLLGRLIMSSMETPELLVQRYEYRESERNSTSSNTYYTTTQVEKEVINDLGFIYGYDVMGNIISIQKGEQQDGESADLVNVVDWISYEYDSKGQLVRENNKDIDQTVVYSYDEGGNITSKKYYEYTTEDSLDGLSYTTVNYTYETVWKDRLLSYNGSPNIEYDGIGNPTEYLGMNMTWQGRELRSVVNENVTTTYSYDTNGYRLRKTTGSEDTEYYYSDGQLVYEKRENDEFFYSYDFNGNLSRIRHKDTNGIVKLYYVAVNTRGDVIRILFDNETYPEYIEYTYDSWGNVVSIKDEDGNLVTSANNIGNLNKIRYRGYYYDDETGFYYLISRYYNPKVGRFLNADGYISTGTGLLGHNMYNYCGNNPVNYMDPTGNCYTNARGDTIHYDCGYIYIDPKALDSVLASMATSKEVLEQGTQVVIKITGYANAVSIKPPHVGDGLFRKKRRATEDKLKTVNKKAEYIFDSLDVFFIAGETLMNAYNNYINNQSTYKIFWDIGVDILVMGTSTFVAAKIGASLGSIGGLGGIALGTVLGVGIGLVIELVDDKVRREMKSWVTY